MNKLLAVILLAGLIQAAQAADPVNLFSTSLDNNFYFNRPLMAGTFANAGGFGIVNNGGVSAPVFRWTPDFKYGALGIGLDINVPLYNGDQVGIDNMVVRYLEYATTDWGARYGLISNVTYGAGLMMSNYTTVLKGGLIPSDQQAGLRAYYKKDIYSLEVLGTWSRVYGARATQQVLPYLTFGQYFVCDADGITQIRPDGTQKVFPSQSGWGVDAMAPFFLNSVLFAEYAKLNNYGGGLSAGISAGYDLALARLNFKAEKRYLDKDFVPEYYNEEYETNPVDIVSYEAAGISRDGYKVSMTGDVLNTAKFWAVLEGYNGSNSALKAEASANLGSQYFAAAGYYQPNFVDARSLDLREGAIITTKLGYKVNPFTQVIANAKRAYDPDQGKVVVTQWYEVALSF